MNKNMKTMDLFMVLAINPKNGGLYTSRTYLRYGLAGMAMLELVKLNRIAVVEKIVEVYDSSSTGDELLDDVLQLIAGSRSSRNITRWITGISYHVSRLEVRVLQRLEDDGFLRIDQSRFLGLFPYKKYVVTNETKRDEIVGNYRNILLSGVRSPDKDSLIVISVAAVCRLVSKLFSKDENKQVKQIYKQIVKGKYFEPEDEVLCQILVSIQKTIAATQAAAAG